MERVRKVEALLRERGFTPFRPSGELMAELAGSGEGGRSGIYVHVMPGREYFYVGLSVDVRDRYLQHLKTYGEIELSAFLPAPKSKLGSLEMTFIALLQENKVPLLNKLVPIDDFDSATISEIFDDQRQARWLKDARARFTGACRHYPEQDLRRYKERYDKFLAHSHYSPEAVRLAGEYIRRCLPEPIRTERNLWMINCLTNGYSNLKATALVRISVHRPEVFTVIVNDRKADIEPVRVLFTISALDHTPRQVDELNRALAAVPGSFENHENAFRTARFHHYRLTVYGYEAARRLMACPAFVKACKAACLRLMHQGQVQRHFSQSHCLPLVQSALAATAKGVRPHVRP